MNSKKCCQLDILEEKGAFVSGEKWGVFVESGLGRDKLERSSGWEEL